MISKEYLDCMRIPPRFQNVSYEKIPVKQRKIILNFATHLKECLAKGWGLLLWGNYGYGKTAAACCLLQTIAELHKTGLFVTFNDIAGYVINHTLYDEEESYLDRILKVDFLVIDEVILSTKDSFKDTCVETIFRKRLNDVKSTLFTSNFSPKQITENYPALSSVMREVILPVKFDSQDFREASVKEIEKFFG